MGRQIFVNHSSTRFRLSQDFGSFQDELLQLRLDYHLQEHGIDLSKGWYNGTIINCRALVLTGQGIVLDTQPISYFDLCTTASAADWFVPQLGSTIRQHLNPKGRLQPINPSDGHLNDENPVSSHLGISPLAFTSDNYLILQQRSPRTFVNHKEEIGPSASAAGHMKLQSGYLDHNSTPSPFASVRAQPQEELGIEPYMIDNLHVMGLTRRLRTMGAISFKFVAQLNVSRAGLEYTLSEDQPVDVWEHDDLIFVKFPERRRDYPKVIKQLIESTAIPSGLLLVLYFLDYHTRQQSLDDYFI